VQALGDGGMLCEQVQGPAQGAGGRLGAGEQEGQYLVVDLLFRQAPVGVLGVAGREERGEQVAAVGVCRGSRR
jgi:hypothetical protein